MDASTLNSATGCGALKATEWAVPLSTAMDEFEINTPEREAMFIAQCAHESALFRFTREIWGPTEAQEGYEGRADLGNTEPGDGKKYMGRGLIMVTGRSNYAAMMMALDIDCLEHPELLEEPVNAAQSAAYFWKDRGLNEVADTGNFARTTRVVNGGTNGAAQREELWEKAKAAI